MFSGPLFFCHHQKTQRFLCAKSCKLFRSYELYYILKLLFSSPLASSCFSTLSAFLHHALSLHTVPAKLGFSYAKDMSHCFVLILVIEAHFCFWLTLFSWFSSIFWFCNSSTLQTKCTVLQPINCPMQIYPWQAFTCLKIFLLLLRLWKS